MKRLAALVAVPVCAAIAAATGTLKKGQIIETINGRKLAGRRPRLREHPADGILPSHGGRVDPSGHPEAGGFSTQNPATWQSPWQVLERQAKQAAPV